ncbi:MAG: class A beta-lactamase-related serine hydrolase [Bacteroidota bacterium]|nr:class A beta-lactamase-related serine hydrolase [Bacteroidota bacterium]
MKPAFISSLPLLMLLVGCTPDTPPPLSGQVQVLLDRHPDAQVAVAVRDPSTSTSLDIQSDREFHAASTMKIPVMIEAWRQVRAGTLAMDQLLEVRNSFRSIVDGSEYAIVDDSDDAIYERLGEQMSVSELIYQMITVSSNLATNLLIEHLSADSIQHTVNSLDASGMQVLRGVEDLKAFELGMSNRTNAQALARLLDLIAHGQAVERAADSTMVEVMLDARFNEMIPAGLPEEMNVAHKTGQITEIHHDAAIVYPPDAQPYVLVILIEGIADDSVSASLGAAITRTIHRALRP